MNKRSLEQLRRHYEVEKSIALKLKSSSRNERQEIYKTMYDELFEKVPDHPRLQTRESEQDSLIKIKRKFKIIKNFIKDNSFFVEFAPGDCRFLAEVSKHVESTIGIDISNQIGNDFILPENCKLIIYNGFTLDEISENSVDIVFSDQLLEHIHPDDIGNHLSITSRILKDEGVYVFRTPHSHSGPHDISKYFSNQPEGFHLKEYTFVEIIKLLQQHNFAKFKCYWHAFGVIHARFPLILFRFMESILTFIPKFIRRRIAIYLIPNIIIAAYKK